MSDERPHAGTDPVAPSAPDAAATDDPRSGPGDGGERLAASMPDSTKARLDESAAKIGERVARRLPDTVTAVVRELLGGDSD